MYKYYKMLSVISFTFFYSSTSVVDYLLLI